MAKCKVGSVVKFTGGMQACLHDITLGKEYKVAGVDEDGDLYIKDDSDNYNFALNMKEGFVSNPLRVGAEFEVVC